MFGFKYTMNKLEHDRIDDKAVRNRINNRVLEVRGREHLAGLFPHVLRRFWEAFGQELDQGCVQEGSYTRTFQQGHVLITKPRWNIFICSEDLSDCLFTDDESHVLWEEPL